MNFNDQGLHERSALICSALHERQGNTQPARGPAPGRVARTGHFSGGRLCVPLLLVAGAKPRQPAGAGEVGRVARFGVPQLPHDSPQLPHNSPQLPHNSPQLPHNSPQLPHNLQLREASAAGRLSAPGPRLRVARSPAAHGRAGARRRRGGGSRRTGSESGPRNRGAAAPLSARLGCGLEFS